MKRALLAFLLALTALPMAATCTKTTVADTVYYATGDVLSGTIKITNPMTITGSDGCVVPANTVQSANVVAGAFSIALIPNSGSTPTGTYYKATYSVSGTPFTETWTVPASGPQTLSGVRALTPPVPTAMIAFSQINPPSPCLNLQNPTWNTATLSWTCTTPTGGITSLNTLSAASQSFSTGTGGTDFGISSVGTTHTFNIPSAANGVRGLLNSADWNTFNNKQAAIAGNTLAANNFATSINAAGTLSGAQPAFSNLSGSATAAQLGSGSATSSTFLHGDLTWGALVSGDIPNNAANTTGSAGSIKGTVSSAAQILESASNSWDVRNGTNAQDFSVYKTFTDASNNSRVHIMGNDAGSSPGVLYDCVGTGPCNLNLDLGNASTTSSANIRFLIAGGAVWLINSSGHLTGNGDNSKDIGTTGASRPRSAYFGTDVNIESAANGAQWKHAYATELLTLSTSGATTDTAGNLLPANSIIEAVEVRVTTTITTATNWSVGDATTAARFCAANATLTAGTTSTCTVHVDQTGAAGPRQTAAAKVRITTTGTPAAGAIRITVFYRVFTPPTS